MIYSSHAVDMCIHRPAPLLQLSAGYAVVRIESVHVVMLTYTSVPTILYVARSKSMDIDALPRSCCSAFHAVQLILVP